MPHNRADLDAAITQLRKAMEEHKIRNILVAVERTGRYHHVAQRAFTAAGFDTRVVHPFATKQFRRPASPGIKTDDTDLAAIHRAAVSGFVSDEQSPIPMEVGLLRALRVVRQSDDLPRTSQQARIVHGRITAAARSLAMLAGLPVPDRRQDTPQSCYWPRHRPQTPIPAELQAAVVLGGFGDSARPRTTST